MLLSVHPSLAQQDGILLHNDALYVFLREQQNAGRLPTAFLAHQPLSAYEAQRYLDSLAHREDLPPIDRMRLQRFRREAPKPGAAWFHRRLPFFYENGHDLWQTTQADYAVQINPLLYTTVGWTRQADQAGRPTRLTTWRATRGLRLSGHIGRFFFESRLEENQREDPALANQTIPERLGFARPTEGSTHLDYFRVASTIGYRTKYVEFRFGHDRHHWGQSRNGLMLSNYAAPYEFLLIRTSIGPFQYTNLYTSLPYRPTPDPISPDRHKYGVFHRLQLRFSGRFQLGIFESAVLAPERGELTPGFYAAFLNPLIFYRAIDLNIGSPANMLIGLDAQWLVHPGLSLNGQFILDDFEADQLFNNPGYWKNTWGVLGGLYLTAPLLPPGLSLQAEYSRLRPYTYSNQAASTGYFTRARSSLGHALGPNTEDWAFFVTYQPTPRLAAGLNLSYARHGRNRPGENFGGDPTISYDENRVSDNDVRLLQGVRQAIWLVEFHAGYELLPDLFAEAGLLYGSLDDEEAGRDFYLTPFMQLRWGRPFDSLRY